MKKALQIIISVLITVVFVIGANPFTVSAARNNTKITATTVSSKMLIVPNGTVNIRSTPSYGRNILVKWSGNQPLSILDQTKDNDGNVWYKVELKTNNTTYKGWCLSTAVTVVETSSKTTSNTKTTTTSTTATTKKTAKKTTTTSTKKTNSTKSSDKIVPNGKVNIRSTPSYGRNILVKWSGNQPLSILDQTKDNDGNVWYKVELKTNNATYKGWCLSTAVTVVEASSKTTSNTKTTTTSTTTTTKKTAKKTTTTSTKKTNTSKTSDYGKKMFSSSYSTNYGNSNKGRKQNIKVTCDYLDGLAIKPGEEFNWFTMMPTTTKAHGYTLAGVFQNGKTVQGMGGGLCQVTSTLYNVCLDLEEKGLVKITARHPHGLPVSYVPPGRDATISRSGKKNFCFKDTSDCILVISAKANGRKCTVTITGYEVKNKKK